jgi:predicted ester cyclase
MDPATSLAGLSPELFFGLAFLKGESYSVDRLDRLVAMAPVDVLPYTYFEARSPERIQAGPASRKIMPPQENIEALQRALNRFGVKDIEGYLALYSNSVIHHGYSSRIRPGIPGLREHYTNLLKCFPDMRVEIEDIISEGEQVVHRFTFSGTHRAEFMGIAATGKLVTSAGIQINRFSGGKCIEVWSVHDTLRFMKQLGVIPKLRDALR